MGFTDETGAKLSQEPLVNDIDNVISPQIRQFQTLPLIDQLTIASAPNILLKRYNLQVRDAALYTLQNLFARESEEWEGIRMYALVNLTSDGETLDIRHGDAETYQVAFAFPRKNGSVGCFTVSRAVLGYALTGGDPTTTHQVTASDEAVLKNAQIIEPSDLDMYVTLIRTIKNIDGAIRPQHASIALRRSQSFKLYDRSNHAELDELHAIKHGALLELLDKIDKLEKWYPNLKPMYIILTDTEYDDFSHIQVQFNVPITDNTQLIQALYNDENLPDETQVHSFGPNTTTLYTNFNLHVRQLATDPDYIELCDRLRERQIWQARMNF